MQKPKKKQSKVKPALLKPKKKHPKVKAALHPRNRHRERYDLDALIATLPQLASFVRPNKYGDNSIDFFNPEAVKALNTALLSHYYQIKNWDIPQDYLCPPIPGRVDYLHYMADLLADVNSGEMPTGEKIRVLDIGVGANCVYPLIGSAEYGWSFVGSDIDPVAIDSARKIVQANPQVKGKIDLRLQEEPKDIFKGIIQDKEHFDFSICNPPFHTSPEGARKGSLRKLSNLKQQEVSKLELNFGGKNNELWCPGGEGKFIQDMIVESKLFSESCMWFSTLVSQQSNLKHIYKTLDKINAKEVKTMAMGQGNKISRIVAWSFI